MSQGWIWKPKICCKSAVWLLSSFPVTPKMNAILVGRDFEDCLGTEILEVHDTDKHGNRFTHHIQRKEFPNFYHYQVVGSYCGLTSFKSCEQWKFEYSYWILQGCFVLLFLYHHFEPFSKQKNAWMTSSIYTLEIKRLSEYCNTHYPGEVFDLGMSLNEGVFQNCTNL